MSEAVTYDTAASDANMRAWREAHLPDVGVWHFVGALCGYVPPDVWKDALDRSAAFAAKFEGS